MKLTHFSHRITAYLLCLMILLGSTAFSQNRVDLKTFTGFYNNPGGPLYTFNHKLYGLIAYGTKNNGTIYYNAFAELTNNLDTLNTRLYSHAVDPENAIYLKPVVTNNAMYMTNQATNKIVIHKVMPNGGLSVGKGYYCKNTNLLSFTKTIITRDSGVIFTGYMRMWPAASYKVPLIKLNANFDTVFYKIYENSFYLYSGEGALDVEEQPNKDLLISGFCDSLDNGDMLLLRTDSMGNIKSSRSIGTPGHEESCRMISIDGKHYLFGTTRAFSISPRNTILLSRIDDNGNTGNSFVIGDGISNFRVDAVESKAHTLFVYGNSNESGSNNAFCMEIDTNGQVLHYHKSQYNAAASFNNRFTSLIQDSLQNVLLTIPQTNNVLHSSIVRLDHSLKGCNPGLPATYTMQPVSGLMHSVNLGFHVLRDSLFATKDSLVLSHGFSGIVDECHDLVGTQDLLKEEITVSVYPNPTTGILSIESEEHLKNVSLFDLLGKEWSVELQDDSKIDMKQLPAGVYILEVNTSSGHLRKKIIKE